MRNSSFAISTTKWVSLFKPAEVLGTRDSIFPQKIKLRYALHSQIHLSTIPLSKQFWQTATARHVADGNSISRNLQDSMFAKEEIFAGLQNFGMVNSPSADPTPSQSIPAISLSHVQMPQPPPQPSSVTTTSSTIKRSIIFEPLITCLSPPSHELRFKHLISSVESEQLRNLKDILIEKVKKLENKLKKKRKSKETKDAEDQIKRLLKQISTPSAQVNTGEINAAEVNTGEAERVQRRKGKEPMTEEDLQAEKIDTEILAEKDSSRRTEQYSIEERAKFLHDTIAAQRKFLAEQRSAIIRNKPPTVSQLRNQMITYLKHVANTKHAEKKDESAHEEVQEEEGAKKRKLGTRRKLKAKRRKHGSSLTREDDDLKICLHIAPDEDKEEYKERLPEDLTDLWGEYEIMVQTSLTSTGNLVFHLLVESRYPLTKEVLSQIIGTEVRNEKKAQWPLELMQVCETTFRRI
ncbi:hypothetical protein Tco_0535536 [Tanacetum coccineum]